jgi:glycogen(starch) synthase
MKILMLGWELPPYNSGGLGVACYQLCRALSSKNIDIEFIVPYSGHPGVDFMKVTPASSFDVRDMSLDGFAYDSYKFTDVQGKTQHINIFDQHSLYEASVAKLASEKEFDVIHAHDWLTFRAALRAKAVSGRPVIAHVHSVESDRAGGQPGNPFVREVERMGMLMADKVIAVSNHTKNRIVADYDIPADKIDVVHNSIDRDALAPLDENNAYRYLEVMKDSGYSIVSNVGRLTVQKNLPNLLHAAALVVSKHPKTLFLVVGSGEQYHELIDLAAQLGISRNVIFTGFLRGKQWRDAYSIADLFVMPSVSEPFGLTPLEAAGYGTPSLISKQSGVAEVLKNCLRVDFWDVNEMANQIVAVLKNSGLRATLSQNASQEFNELGWHQAADTLESLYTQHAEAYR